MKSAGGANPPTVHHVLNVDSDLRKWYMMKKMPVTPLKKFVASMHFSQREQIISDFVDWTMCGTIGDCELRRSANKFMSEIGLDIHSILN